MPDKIWRPIVWLLLALLLIPFAWIGFAKLLGVPLVPSADSTGLLATMGGVVAAIFTVGGLVIALVAILTQLTLADRAKQFMEEKYQELLPDLLDRAERRINAQILMRDARQAIDDSLWPVAEIHGRRALSLNPDLPEARSTLGLAMSEAVAYRFRLDHALESPPPPLPGGEYAARPPTPPIVDAITWLQKAEEHSDTQHGRVQADLALMYGVNGQTGKMVQAIKRAVTANPELRAYLSAVERLPLLASAYAGESSVEKALAEVTGQAEP